MPVEEVGYAQGTNTPYVSAMYLIGPRGPEYRRDVVHQSVAWYVYDGLGSIVEEVDPSGNITASRKYDVYGMVRSGQLGSSSQKYVGGLGHESDTNTGLIYMRARYMDPVLGRFLSEDPGRDGANWFVYCGGEPVSFFDQSGRDFDLASSLTTIGISGLLGAISSGLADLVFQGYTKDGQIDWLEVAAVAIGGGLAFMVVAGGGLAILSLESGAVATAASSVATLISAKTLAEWIVATAWGVGLSAVAGALGGFFAAVIYNTAHEIQIGAMIDAIDLEVC
jgi:RHS repeat-associated protein